MSVKKIAAPRKYTSLLLKEVQTLSGEQKSKLHSQPYRIKRYPTTNGTATGLCTTTANRNNDAVRFEVFKTKLLYAKKELKSYARLTRQGCKQLVKIEATYSLVHPETREQVQDVIFYRMLPESNLNYTTINATNRHSADDGIQILLSETFLEPTSQSALHILTLKDSSDIKPLWAFPLSTTEEGVIRYIHDMFRNSSDFFKELSH